MNYDELFNLSTEELLDKLIENISLEKKEKIIYLLGWSDCLKNLSN